MLFAFKLGPLEFEDAPSSNLYVAVAPDKGPVGMADAIRDAEGLRELQKQLHGASFTCEPALATAARRLGLSVEPLPEDVVRLRGVVALGMAMGPELRLDPPLLLALAEASAAFEKVRPWEAWTGEELFRVGLSGAVRGTREAVVMGGLGDTFGLAMYDTPGTVARLASARDVNAEELRTRSTTLLFEDGPRFALAPLREAFGLTQVPMAVRREQGRTLIPSAKELVALVAVLAVIAEASGEDEVDRELAVQGIRVRARVQIPPASAPDEDLDSVFDLARAAPTVPEAPPPEPSAPEVPRNAPCPCGSGKKYKKCHGLESTAKPLGPLQPHETDALERRLIRQLSGLRRERAHDAYPISRQDLQAYDLQLFGPWSIYLFRFDGRTELERFLASEGSRLSSREREFLEAQHESPFSILEIEAVRQGEGFSLRDVLTGERFEVLERMGSRSAERWMGILARPVSFGGVTRLYGMHPRPMNPEGLAFAERRACEVLGLKPGERTTREWLHQPGKAEALILAWEEAVSEVDNRPLPQFQNTDGELLEPVKLIFEFDRSEREAIAAGLEALAESPEQSRGQAIYTFLRSGNRMHPDWENTIVGRALLKDDSLELEANSRKRATALRQKVVRKLGKKIRFVSREVEDVGEMLEDSRGARPKPYAVPPPEALEAARAFIEQHYRSWPDVPLPAFKGMTPREAARDPAMRREVLQLLKEIESGARRSLPPIDVSFLWHELGLSPGA
ncbi:MAG: SEC-C domain-containing protein [Deltaproteobacteria bacterium]|nr:SEC-C domain-containing protein [Deltaproteobacteria bacterium]